MMIPIEDSIQGINFWKRLQKMAWCYWCVISLRVVLGMAAIVCCMFAGGYLAKVGEAIEKATKEHGDNTQIFYYSEISVGILGLPVAMFHLSQNKVGGFRFLPRMIKLLVVSYTMLLSATATAVKFGKEDVLTMLAFVLGSIVLLEAAFLTEENFGVFELALTVVVVQCIQTYSTSKPDLYGLILIAYCVREVLMFFMRYVDEIANPGNGDAVELMNSWKFTNSYLRSHNIDVDTDLPKFMAMKVTLERMKQQASNRQDSQE